MAGNIIVASIPNLKPENIKKGEYVGGVGPGTWEGYIVRDPATFYYRGTFAPGQSIMAFKYSGSSDIMSPNLGKRQWSFMAMKIPEGNIMFSCLILRLILPQKAN